VKILHVIPSVGPRRGGPSFAVRSIASGLAACGVETHVATTDDNGPGKRLDVPYGQPRVEDGAAYWYFPRQSEFYLYSAPFSGWMWRHAADYDLIHIHALFSWCSNMAAYIASRLGVPYVIRPVGVLNRWGMQERRPWLKRLSFALIERHLLQDAAFIHYTAEQERVEAAHCGFRDRPVIIPNPVETPDANGLRGELRRRYPELQNRRLALFLSRIDRKKGLDLLIPAFAGVLREMPDSALVIAGDGDDALKESLTAQCRALGIEGSVFWPGFLSGNAKAAALADADIFVLPSYSENFGIAVVEAMALGIPVIVTEQVAICREVAASRSGLIVAAAVDPIRNAILELFSDRGLLNSLGSNAMATARSQFSTPAVIQKLIAAYSAAVQEPIHW
jgi:glycosyltransferase involved in cell wall biosynthesis